ncbi:Acetolactate synthase isozyme 2 large subunit [Candidatus Entotheonellaceae bacterium PAL068K]
MKSTNLMTATPRTKNRGADLLAGLLQAQGVEHIMGLTGGAIMEGMDALQANEKLDMTIFQTEPGAAWAAMGYARATGKVGVCVVTSGPAATNTITPIADAYRDNIPLVVITGQVPTFARNTDAFQETNITEIAAPTAKKVYYLSRPEEMPAVVSEAFRIAKSGRPGPVLIDLTKDAQQAEVDPDEFTCLLSTASPHTTLPTPVNGLSDKALDEVAAYLRRAKRPVIIAGYGVILAEAQRELARILEAAPCAVVHTLPGKAALPRMHPCNYGMLGMHGFFVANWLVQHADLVLSFGSRYDDRITGDAKQFAPQAQCLIHFDIDAQQICKVLPERKLGVVGDLKQSLAALYKRLHHAPLHYTEWHADIAAVEAQHPSTYKRRPGQLQTQHALEVLNDAVRQQVTETGQPVIFTTEVGDHQMWAGQYLNMQAGWQFMTSSGQGAMGSGLPMAIGAQIAHPEALVICLAGDGSLRFSEAELETVWQNDLPVKILVVNNDGYGIVRMWNHRFYEGRETGVVKRGKDWTLLARSNGFTPERVDRVTAPEALESVLQQAVSHRHPHCIDLVTPYEECLPIMPPGKSFYDIIEE